MIDYKFQAYSIAGAIILIGGTLRLYVYSKCFSISVLPFLEASEIITIFFDNLLYFLCFLILNFLVIVFLYKKTSKLYSRTTKTSFCERLLKFGFIKRNKIISFVLLAVVLFFISKNRDHDSFYEFYLWLGLLLVAISINPLVYFEFKYLVSKRNFALDKLTLIFLISAINLMFFAFSSGMNEAYKVKNKQYYIDTEFEIDTCNTIISTIDYYYIGKTKQFIFFYDSKKKETDVFPISRITKMKFKK